MRVLMEPREINLTATELADLLKVTKQAVMKRAQKETWHFIEGKARGGRVKQYLLHSLPLDIQLLYNKDTNDSLPAPFPGDAVRVAGGPPVVPSTSGEPSPLTDEQYRNALAKADLLRFYLTALKKAGWGQKQEARDTFMTAYNSGFAYPKLYAILGEVNWKTIEGWKTLYQKTKDPLVLADCRGYWKRGRREITDDQSKVLLACALHPNRPRISEAIRMARAVMTTKGVRNGHSDATYRRWLEDWKSKNYHIWVFNREGAKAWNDKCAYYIQRDYTLINVGDILVADGHILNFEIINPLTGKAKRMVLIVWKDMKSNFPLGWEIMPTENTQAISSALRRAILRLGKYPKVAYLDNGRAFKSRFFRGVEFDQEGFEGLYERLGIKTLFAWPYHGQSKTIERFFGTFAELERWSPTYVGTSIDRKPPRMLRGERLHRKVHEKMTGGAVLTLEQAHRAIAAWFDLYVQRPQRGHLDGQTPLELFEAEHGPGIDPNELQYLMMSLEIRSINRNGISLLGQNFYDPALYGRRHPVIVRYDLQDPSCIFVFEKSGELLCEARPVDKVHPAANILGTDEDRRTLKKHIAFKKYLEKEASSSARAFLEQEIIPEHRRFMAQIGCDPRGLPYPDTTTDLPEPADYDEARIRAEVEARQREGGGTSDFWSDLDECPEMDRYERLIECDIQGMLIPKQWQAFMRYYEMTPEYDRHREYWEEYRAKMALMYQAGE